MYERVNRWLLAEAARVSSVVRALAVWDRASSGGAGGTESFVGLADELGIEVEVIDLRPPDP